MKLRALKSVSDKITENKIYQGTFVLDFEFRQGVQPALSKTLKVVVYNNDGRWSQYSAIYFAPVEK